MAEGNSIPGELYQFDNPPGYGAVHEEQELESIVYEAAPEASTVELPSSVDLSRDNWFPKIRCQSGGSCVAWATTYYQFTYEAARLNNWDAKHDDSKVFSPKYVWNYLNGGENRGVGATNCYIVLSQQGSLRWSEFPQENVSFEWYQGSSDTQTTETLQNALKTRLSKYIANKFAETQGSTTTSPVITGYNDPKLSKMKELLYEGHPLTIYTYVNSFYTETLSNGQRGCLYMKGTNGYHAMTVVGYDDTVFYDLNQNGTIEDYEKGAFLVANSWGEGYGDGGYIWVLYDALNKVSNVDNLCLDDRQPIFEDNRYFHIEVANYSPKRMAEVTVEQKYRNDFTIKLYTAYDFLSLKRGLTTVVNGAGGKVSFDGGGSDYQTRTFVFDYGYFGEADKKILWVTVCDNNENDAETRVKKIRWLDEYGNSLKTIEPQKALDMERCEWYYGVPAKSVSLDKCHSTLYIGQEEQLTATVLPANTTDKSIQWISSDESVVRVDENGVVTCVGTGNATITAMTMDGSNCIASCEYEIADDYSNIYDMAYRIQLHSKTSGKIETNGDEDFFAFTPTTSGVYLLYTTGSLDTMGYLYNEAQNLLMQNDDASIAGTNFAIKYMLEANKTYFIKIKAYSTKTGDYLLNIAKGFYEASLASNNQDARRVQMQAEAATVLTSLKLKIGSNTYILNRPTSGNLETTVDGSHFRVSFFEKNDGLSTIWIIEAKIPATTEDSDSVSFVFSKGSIEEVSSPELTGLIAYDSVIKTGVETNTTDSLQRLLTTMQQTGYTLTVRNFDNTLVNVTSTTKAATGMKIIKTNTVGQIVAVYYVVVFGDVAGGTTNPGNGTITADDALEVQQYIADKANLEALATLAADTDHNGYVTAKDSLLILKDIAGSATIDQNHVISYIPDECYYLDPVI